MNQAPKPEPDSYVTNSAATNGLPSPMLPNKPRGATRLDDRRVLNGIFGRATMSLRHTCCRHSGVDASAPRNDRIGRFHGVMSVHPLGLGLHTRTHGDVGCKHPP
jgi:hypothetical protein